jgi:hypothetical protein
MTETKVDKASKKAHLLDDTTQTLIRHIETKDRRFRFWSSTLLIVLLLIGIAGIYKQNQIAQENANHINCIVKLFTTPLPSQDKSRTLVNADTTCNVKFVQ